MLEIHTMRNTLNALVFAALLAAESAAQNSLPMLDRSAIHPRFAEIEGLDLRRLPTGDVLAKHDAAAISWKDVDGPKAKHAWRNEKRVEIRDRSLRVNWPEPTTKYGGTLFLFQNCEEVVYWQSGKATKDGYRLFRADHFLYLFPRPNFWMRGQGVEIKDRESWLAEGLERGTRVLEGSPAFVDQEARDLRPQPASPAVGFGSAASLSPRDRGLRVARDFNGTPRPDPPTAGAFEAAH